MPATGSGEGGTTFLLDLPQATALRDGDGLVLDDSSIVRVGTASAVDPRHPTKRAAMSSTFREMAITMAAVMSLRRGTRLSLYETRYFIPTDPERGAKVAA